MLQLLIMINRLRIVLLKSVVEVSLIFKFNLLLCFCCDVWFGNERHSVCLIHFLLLGQLYLIMIVVCQVLLE